MMRCRRWLVFIICGVMVICGGMAMVRVQPKQTENQESAEKQTKQESGDVQKEVEQVGEQSADYIDNQILTVQMGYFTSMKNGGTVEKFQYTTRDYTGGMQEYEKQALVYLPQGYDSEDADARYDIIYLMHGGGDDEKWFFGDGGYDADLKCILDHMIANGELPPCIVCTPTYQNPYSGNDFEEVEHFAQEFEKDLMPAVEKRYHTYYDSVSGESSRRHRAFGGFSMGAAATWWIFEKCMADVAYFIPISGDSMCAGKEKVRHLSEAVDKQGYSAQDFLLFYGSGDQGDIAYQNVVAQVKDMKSGQGIFTYCKNYREGNFFYGKVDGGGHDINTACEVLYSGLQSLFSGERKEGGYYDWAEGILLPKEPKKAAEKDDEYYYGKLKKYYYYSSTARRRTGVNVLLPPNYEKEEKYPVVYLLHGYYDDEDWMASDSVELKRVLGNLINKGKAKEMIVVMPYIFCSPEQEKCTGMDLQNTLAYDNFVKDLTGDLMPFIEKRFSVATGRENTAITGFSMGGREAIYIGITHPELFGYVGGVCPAPGLTPGSDLSQHPGQLQEEELAFSEGKEPYLFLLSAAEDDPAVGKNPYMLHGLLNKNKGKHLWNVIPQGGHGADSVRVHLYNYLRMVFRNKNMK